MARSKVQEQAAVTEVGFDVLEQEALKPGNGEFQNRGSGDVPARSPKRMTVCVGGMLDGLRLIYTRKGVAIGKPEGDDGWARIAELEYAGGIRHRDTGRMEPVYRGTVGGEAVTLVGNGLFSVVRVTEGFVVAHKATDEERIRASFARARAAMVGRKPMIAATTATVAPEEATATTADSIPF